MEQRAGPIRACLALEAIDSSRVPSSQTLHQEANILCLSAEIDDQMDMIVTHMDAGNTGCLEQRPVVIKQ
jgi:hypothetical protein